MYAVSNISCFRNLMEFRQQPYDNACYPPNGFLEESVTRKYFSIWGLLIKEWIKKDSSTTVIKDRNRSGSTSGQITAQFQPEPVVTLRSDLNATLNLKCSVGLTRSLLQFRFSFRWTTWPDVILTCFELSIEGEV